MSTQADTFELIELEEMFNEDLKCEFEHSISSCSVDVTHQIIWCRGSIHVCINSVKKNFEDVSNTICGGCYHKASECWRIVLI